MYFCLVVVLVPHLLDIAYNTLVDIGQSLELVDNHRQFLVFAENSGMSIDADLVIMLGFKQFKGVIVDEQDRVCESHG